MSQQTIAYVMSRFPKLSETFVLYEMLELRRLGFEVVVFPLRLVKGGKTHPDVDRIQDRIFSAPLLSLRTFGINLKWLLRHPIRYVGTLLRAAMGTVGSLKLFSGALLYYPKAVVFADRALAMGVSHVHAHFCTHPTMAAWTMRRLCGVSYSFTAHATDLHVQQHMLKEKTREAAFAVTISDYNVRFIADHCGRETADGFDVIHCGVDLSVFQPLEREAPSMLKESEGPLEILCVARYEPLKGHRVLIAACADLKKRGVDFRCRLIGGGDLEKEIHRQIVFQGLEKHVLVEGEKSRPEVQEYVRAADVIVLASLQTKHGSREGIPVALMEGMACELPAVAPRLSGIPELIEDGVSGLLFEPGQSDEVADALEKLATDSRLRKTMGGAARQRVEAEFDLEKNATKLANRIKKGIQDV